MQVLTELLADYTASFLKQPPAKLLELAFTLPKAVHKLETFSDDLLRQQAGRFAASDGDAAQLETLDRHDRKQLKEPAPFTLLHFYRWADTPRYDARLQATPLHTAYSSTCPGEQPAA